MSLDNNLFTLVVTPTAENVVDLVDTTGRAHYRKQRIPGPVYRMELYDPLSEALLATATAPSAKSKLKVIELVNPTSVVELKNTGTLTFRWSFKFEEHEFEWKREECFMLRKPDPPVLVAVTKEPSGRLKTTCIQILDYNLNRFDIEDRKGLEIVLLTSLMTFNDANELAHAQFSSGPMSPVSPQASDPNVPMSPSSTLPTPTPPLAPRPPKKLGIDRIAEMQAVRGLFNEVAVEEEGSVEDYGQYCANLFQDDAMLFVTILSDSAAQVPKVLQVVEETKRIRHKAELEALHQYVLYDTQVPKGPKRINLDDVDPAKDKYKPPQDISVHLSKIAMVELQPKVKTPSTPPPPPPIVEPKKESKKEQKKREEAERKRKEDKKVGKSD
ncbi:hypothetical protein FB45DRAFT_998609 [Roridomyces roridus]|uniref:Uncharacterized protein n=1 Tax=Roridomyces roridus TaxID=1738132 RepID=A0AAD7CFP4_9AGAR|nr:hypothetical protein FB45DRAFT_998609 [Roridomyces roridus]